MSYYIGIDLGTTNSAICSYDGQNVRIWKSPEQNDVTPSAIYIDRRGNRYYGTKAYNQAPYHPDNSATLFKRFMGTTTKIPIKGANIELTPEECSAEILRVLYSYLPEEIRNDPETATVITVPAAFNQMKKDATLQAAKLAGIGKVALMQEPVAAIMSVMRSSKTSGIFLVYDLGGGTFDVSIAENTNGKVRLLSHGGIEMCGGRDIDRLIFDSIVVPWLRNSNFDLPDDFRVNPKYRTFCRIALWAVEQAKIELSYQESATIALGEMQSGVRDESGMELYLDIDINREQMNPLIDELTEKSIDATREILTKAGLTANDITKVVFVGGPTNFKPLRDRVSQELAIPTNIDVNPMTAVAEGASIFAESIDWSSEEHNRKNQNETISTNIDLELKYTARTPEDKARIMCLTGAIPDGLMIQFTSTDNGWSSGNAPLKNRLMMTLPLTEDGDNRFAVTVSDNYGRPVNIGVSTIVITRTLATIGAIPASHSIGVEVLDKLGGTPRLEFLVSEGDPLPKKGNITFKAGQTLRAGSNETINIKLWEGNIQSPISDNRFVGVMKIAGTDIPSGIIQTGADIECEYEMSDSGTIRLEASVPSVGATFSNRNFYSRQEGQVDLTDVDSLAEQGRSVMDRIREMSSHVYDERLEQAKKKASLAAAIDSKQSDAEDVQMAHNELLEAKKLINQARQDNLRAIRQAELDAEVDSYNQSIRRFASDTENQIFDNLSKTAQRSIDRNDNEFETVLDEMKGRSAGILLKQDWFILDLYRNLVSNPAAFFDRAKFIELKRLGDMCLSRGDADRLRPIIGELLQIRIRLNDDDPMADIANIIKG